jgi:hypothetical protein
MAFVPGTRRQTNYPSTVAYLAQLIIHRYAMLGILDEQGLPLRRWASCRRRAAAPGAAEGSRVRCAGVRQPDDDPQGRL